MYDFHLALGQFLNYRMTLEKNEPDRVLYLAVPLDAYQSFFQRPLYLPDGDRVSEKCHALKTSEVSKTSEVWAKILLAPIQQRKPSPRLLTKFCLGLI